MAVSEKSYEELRLELKKLLILKEILEDILNYSGNRMFSIVSRTWNPVTGCLHYCRYCWARRFAETKLRDRERYRRGFIPRLNLEEFAVKFRKGEFVFVSDMGDLFGNFIPKEWILRVISYIKKFPETHFLFLTKNPARYHEFIDIFPSNAFLGATIETNRDEIYRKYSISKAPLPSQRYIAMKTLKWDKKFISIEPILDFDLKIFIKWMEEIDPIIIYIGYDNYNNRLPEPKLAKTLKLIENLSPTSFIIKKTIRKAWNEGLEKYVKTKNTLIKLIDPKPKNPHYYRLTYIKLF